MCIQGMQWGLWYILQVIRLMSIEELTTKAHDMELSMALSGAEGSSTQESRKFKDKQEIKKGGKLFSKAPTKESMTIMTTTFKFHRNDTDTNDRGKDVMQDRGRRKFPEGNVAKTISLFGFRCPGDI
ncbi:hypothetical protein ACS0TY_024720 [Phlomoides rotata]